MRNHTRLRTLWKICLPTLALFAVSAASNAAAFKVAWTRTNASAGINMDTIHDGLGISWSGADGDDVCEIFAGGSMQPGGSFKGNITSLKPNRNLADFVEIVPPGGGSLQFHKILFRDGFLYAIGQAFPTGSQDGQIYFGKFDSNLNLVMEHMEAVTPTGGFEEPTDCDFDSDGNIHVVGVAQKGVRYESFHIEINGQSGGYLQTIGRTEFGRYNKPQVTVNGIIAILIGLLTDTGAKVQSYQPNGMLNWSFGASNSGSQSVLADTTISGYGYCSIGKTEEIMPGIFESWSRVSRINLTNGMEAGFYETPRVPGNGIVSPRDSASGQATGKRVNFLIDQGNRARVYSFDAAITASDDWESPFTSVFSGGLFVDQYGEVCAALCNNENVTGFKLNANNDLRFSWGLNQTILLLPYLEQDNLYNKMTGDIVNWRSDKDSMAITLIQQAPVAISDGVYRPKTGVLFRNTLPITNNDRYAKGATITITQQPMHGTVTMGATGYFNYTSVQGYTGVDSFKYQLTKPGLDTSTATVNLNVRP
ncbi:MAG: Ig-like domain-containing protein [Fimbriimonadaceae bacterium]